MTSNQTTEEELRRSGHEDLLRQDRTAGQAVNGYLEAECDLTQGDKATAHESWADWSEKQHRTQDRAWSRICSFSCSYLAPQY
jgi:hypothetical protein